MLSSSFCLSRYLCTSHYCCRAALITWRILSNSSAGKRRWIQTMISIYDSLHLRSPPADMFRSTIFLCDLRDCILPALYCNCSTCPSFARSMQDQIRFAQLLCALSCPRYLPSIADFAVIWTSPATIVEYWRHATRTMDERAERQFS